MSYNTIKIKKYGDNIEELIAAGAITPGHIVEITSAGTVQSHATAGGNVAPLMVALEDELQGKVITEAYSSGNPVQVWHPLPGDRFYGILADGNDVEVGDLLESNGDGTLRKHVIDSTGAYYLRQIVGKAREAVDTSGSLDATRIDVEAI